MQLPVMVTAQRDQVLKARLAPVGPVADVVGIGPAMPIAAGEAAAAVAYPLCTEIHQFVALRPTARHKQPRQALVVREGDPVDLEFRLLR